MATGLFIDGQATTLPRLAKAWHYAKEDPNARIPTGLWSDPIWTGAQLRAYLLRKLNYKISWKGRERTAAPRFERGHAVYWPPRGRKHDADYQADLAHDARTINDYYGKRIRHYGCRNILRTPEMRRRYPQVNTQPYD